MIIQLGFNASVSVSREYSDVTLLQIMLLSCIEDTFVQQYVGIVLVLHDLLRYRY